MPIKLVAVLLISVNFIFASSAFAYIDPNTGGFFFQTIAPFVYGILGVIVVFWKRITGFVKRLFGRNKGNSHSADIK